jgi:hypothetical protein
LHTRRAAPFGHGQVGPAEPLVDAATDEDLPVVWLALEMLTAAIARAAAAQATCLRIVGRPGSRRNGRRNPGRIRATPRPFEMIAFAFTRAALNAWSCQRAAGVGRGQHGMRRGEAWRGSGVGGRLRRGAELVKGTTSTAGLGLAPARLPT